MYVYRYTCMHEGGGDIQTVLEQYQGFLTLYNHLWEGRRLFSSALTGASSTSILHMTDIQHVFKQCRKVNVKNEMQS